MSLVDKYYDYFYGISVTDGLIKQLSTHYDGIVSLGLYPLSEEKADYNGMAECYRNYLIKKGFIATDNGVRIGLCGTAVYENETLTMLQKEMALIDFDEALDFYRGNKLIDTIGLQLGISSDQLDKFFISNDYKELIIE